jgi:hypothetical protein
MSGIYINNNINYNELFTNIYVVVLCLCFAFMLLCYVYYFAFMLLCYIYFLNLCCYAMFFFLFIVACTPMPACPANYQRIGIPAGVAGAGTILQSCYKVITAPGPVNFLGASVSICTCCKLC